MTRSLVLGTLAVLGFILTIAMADGIGTLIGHGIREAFVR